MEDVLGPRDVGLAGRGSSLVVISIVFTSLALLLVILRIGARLFAGLRLGADDVAIAFSVVNSTPLLYAE